MKKFFFTLMVMVTFALVANNAMSQGKYTPVKGSIYTYTVEGLTAGNDVVFSLNQSTTAPGGTVGGTLSSPSSKVDVDGKAHVTIEWTGAAGSYNLWIVVTGTGAGTCSNQSYKVIPLSDNTFNATIIALGTNVATEYPSWATASERTQDCPAYSTGADFAERGSDGSSYVFFKVSKTGDNGGAWDFSVDCDAADKIEYYNGAWTTTAPTNLPVGTNSMLVRMTEANVPLGFDLTATVTASERNGAASIVDTDNTDDSFTISINQVPNMSTITFN